MVARHIVHTTDHFQSLQDAAAAAAHDRPPEFYLSESDIGCFLSLPCAHQRIYANASTVMNIHQAFTLYTRLLQSCMKLLCKSVEVSKSQFCMKHNFNYWIQLLSQFRRDQL